MKTDWNKYYSSGGVFLSHFTRSYLLNYLDSQLTKHLHINQNPYIIEFGGGNSILLPLISKLKPKKYLALDTNQLGIDLLINKSKSMGWVTAQKEDCLTYKGSENADLVLSIGLIEHFSQQETLKLIDNHFSCAKQGALVVLTFPTPTWLYRISRRISEALGLWHFHDETPLPIEFVTQHLLNQATLLSTHILWPQIFTQAVIVARKKYNQTRTVHVSLD